MFSPMWKCIFLVLALASPAHADFFAALRAPGTHLVMRHALAPGTGDPPGFQVRDCDSQRNLDQRGRAQARAIGAALRETGLAFDQVLSSQWCRCLETARLLDLGPVQAFPVLNSFFGNRATGPDQTRDLRSFLDGLDGRAILVTHQVNITALTGRAVRSGEVFAIRAGPSGVEVLGSLTLPP